MLKTMKKCFPLFLVVLSLWTILSFSKWDQTVEHVEVAGPHAWRNVNICAFDKSLEVLHKARVMRLGDHSLQNLFNSIYWTFMTAQRELQYILSLSRSAYVACFMWNVSFTDKISSEFSSELILAVNLVQTSHFCILNAHIR